jgi:amino acid adenylation domain-containing protein/non-ribosomal peptide synthase protein (TIGR01720 family)
MLRNKQNIQDIYPLTPLQQGMLYHAVDAGESDPYLTKLCFRLEGAVDVACLERAWQKVVQRHECLRADVVWEKTKEPLLIVYRHSRPELWRLSFQAEGPPIDVRLRTLFEEESRRFDLKNAADSRLLWIDRGAEEHYLVWVHHHLFLDGWSVANVLSELLSLYGAERAGRPLELAQVPPYGVYLEWLKAQSQPAALGHYRTLLADLPSLEFPPRGGGDGAGAGGYAELRVHLDRRESARLVARAKEWRITPNTLFQGVWALVIKAFTGSDDVVFGATVAGRSADIAGVQALVGLFINTLPVRVRAHGQERVASWLVALQAANAHSQGHEFVGLPSIRAESSLPPGVPLFESIVVFENYPVSAVLARAGSEGVAIGVCRPDERSDGDRVTGRGRNNYPLSLVVSPGAEIEVVLAYHLGRVSDALARTLIDRASSIARAMVEAPDATLAGVLARVTQAEARQLRAVEASRPYPFVPIHAWIGAHAAASPAAIAVRGEQSVRSWRDLDRQARAVASTLRAHGVGLESRVGLCLPRSPEWVVAMLGVLYSGAAYVPFEPGQPPARLAELVSDSAVRVIIGGDEPDASLAALGVPVVAIGESAAGSAWVERAGTDERAVPPESAVTAESAVYVIYTSGSTGRPKGVVVTHGALHNYVQGLLDRLALPAGLSMAMVSTVAADLGNTVLFGALCSGRTLHLLPDDSVLDPERLGDYFERHGVDVLKIVPSHLAGLMAAGPPARVLPRHTLVIGGEAASADLLARVAEHGQCRIINHYGPTETTVGVLTHEVASSGPARLPLPLGRPLANSRVYVLSGDLMPVPPGATGEIFIGGAGVARGYLERPNLTAERFIPDPYGSPGARLYRTGDRGQVLDSGEVAFLGRIDGQVKVRGYRVELGEIKTQLASLPEVADAVVLVRSGQAGNARLIAYLVSTPPAAGGASPEQRTERVQAALAQRLPEYMLPSDYVWLESFPVTKNGKLDTSRLPDSAVASGGLSAAPEGEVESEIAKVWREVLRLEHVGTRDNFFKVGGDSILALQVIARLRKAGYKLTPKVLFANPTVADLARLAPTLRAAGVAAGVGAGSGHGLGPMAVPTGRSEPNSVPDDFALAPIQSWFFEQRFLVPQHWNQSLLFVATEAIDTERLSRALEHVCAEHPALRLRFVTRAGVTRQSYARGAERELCTRVDLSREADPRASIERFVSDAQRSLHLERGPLIRAQYLDFGRERPGRLFIVVHHLAMDGVSWRIMLDDLERTYHALGAGQEPESGLATSSYRSYVEALQNHARGPEVRAELGYWQRVLGEPWQALPAANPDGQNRVCDQASLSVELDAATTNALLREAPAAYRTEINDLLLTALGRALCIWAGRSSVLVELEGHGREDLFDGLDLSRSVGWFTTLYPLRLRPSLEENPRRALLAMKQTLRSVPNKGIGFGVLRHLCPEGAALAQLPWPEVTFNYLGRFDGWSEAGALLQPASESVGPGRDPESPRRTRLEFAAWVHDGRFQLELVYSQQIHDARDMLALLERYRSELTRLIEHCVQSERGGATVGDFPLLRLSQSELDDLPVDFRAVEDIYPMTPMQQGILVHSIVSAGTGIYHMQNTSRVDMAVDAELFMRAWQIVGDRHAILRTAFLMRGESQALQVVYRRVPALAEVIDWSHLPQREHEAALDRLLEAELARGFDLGRPSAFHVRLIRLGPDAHYVVRSHHHILMDAWCNSLVLDDFFNCYQALLAGREPELPKPPPFRTYLEWLSRQDVEEARRFWKEELSGLRHPTPLGFAAVPDDGGLGNDRVADAYEFLTPAQTVRLAEVARGLELTTNTFVQAAWALVLAQHAGMDDVMMGVTVSGRPVDLPSAENIIGLFIQSIPLRLRIRRDQAVSDWLREVFRKNTQIRQYEYLPLTEIRRVSEIRTAALFHSLFVFENAPFDEAVAGEAAAFKVTGLSSRTHTNYPITVVIYPGEKLGLHLSYNGELFEEVEVRVLLRQFRTALEGLMAGLECPVGEISLIGPAEREVLEALSESVNDWGPAGVAAAGAHGLEPWRSYVERFEAQAARQPNRVAASCIDEAVTYGELNVRANRIAHALAEAGVGRDDVVALLDQRGLELFAAVLGTLKAGAAFLPLDPGSPPQRSAEILSLAGVRALITRGELAAVLDETLRELPEAERPWLLRYEESQARSGSEQNLGRALLPGQLAYVIYTSGSTGTPKGVMVEHRGMLNNQQSKLPFLSLGESDVIAQTASQCFDISVWQLLAAVLAGARIDIVPDEIAHDPRALFDHVAARGVTVLQSVPALLASALGVERLPSAERLALRWVLPTGEALPSELARRWFERYPGIPLVNAYGPAECSDDVSLAVIRDAPLRRGGSVSIGRAVPGTRLYVLGPRLERVPLGVTGELCIAGVGVGRGYLGDRARTAAAFVPNPDARDPGDRLYRSGDLVRCRADGSLEFVGRADHQVKLRGYRIELGEIESRLGAQPGVAQAAVLMREDVPGEKRLVAYIVPAQQGSTASSPADGASLAAASSRAGELRAALKAELPEYMVPALYVTLPALPLTSNRKLDRDALPAPDVSATQKEYVAPETAPERQLAEIWSELLRVERIGQHDDFFELGGDSIVAIQVVSRAKQIGLAIGPRQVFQHPTLAALARVAESTRSLVIDQGPAQGSLELTPIQRWFFEQRIENPHHFNQATLLEVRRPLDPSLLERALQRLVQHHDALRLAFREENGRVVQWYRDGAEPELCWHADVSGEADMVASVERLANRAHRSLHLERGPLIRAVNISRGPTRGGRLLLSVHHLVMDGVSFRVLLEDLAAIYSALEAGQEPVLPAKTSSFQSWSDRLVQYATRPSLQGELEYWLGVLAAGGIEFPRTNPSGERETGPDWLNLELDERETAQLLNVAPRAYQTQINDLLLTALADAVTRWNEAHGTRSNGVLVALEGHGREDLFEDVDVTRTIGWFTSVYPVRLTPDTGDLGSSIRRVRDELRRVPERGVGYGVLRYLSAESERLAEAPTPPVLFNYLGQFDQVFAAADTRFAPCDDPSGEAEDPQNRFPWQIGMNAMVIERRLSMTWNYDPELHRHAAIRGLAERYVRSLRAVIRHCVEQAETAGQGGAAAAAWEAKV